MVLEVSSLSFSYGDVSVLENISFSIKKGDFVAIIGPNGSGKTSLVKIILGLLKAEKGKIKLFGKNIDTFSGRELIGYVPQRFGIDKNFPGTVKEILSLVGGGNGIVAKMELENLLPKRFVDLSGGQQQRVLIAMALKHNPELLILDEPTAGIDVQAQQSFYRLLAGLNKSGVTILLITHEIGVVPSIANRVLCINHKICCYGSPKDLPKFLEQIYGSQFAQHHHRGHQHA